MSYQVWHIGRRPLDVIPDREKNRVTHLVQHGPVTRTNQE